MCICPLGASSARPHHSLRRVHSSGSCLLHQKCGKCLPVGLCLSNAFFGLCLGRLQGKSWLSDCQWSQVYGNLFSGKEAQLLPSASPCSPAPLATWPLSRAHLFRHLLGQPNFLRQRLPKEQKLSFPA